MQNPLRFLVGASIVLVGAAFWVSIRPAESPVLGADEPDAAAADVLYSPPVLQRFNIGGDFVLDAHDGSVFDLAAHRGEVFLLFFGYTRCPDFCPATLSLLAQVSERLGDRASGVTTLFVSIDPQHDGSERLGEYLGYFGVPAIGLSGSVDRIDDVVAAYAGSYETVSSSENGPMFGHSAYTYLIDRAGGVRYTFRPDDAPRFIADGVNQVLDEAVG